jgi:hypothetical protein
MMRRTLVAPSLWVAALAMITISCRESTEPTALAEDVVGAAARAVPVASLQIVGGLNGMANAVNNRGEVVGQNCEAGCLTRAFYWTEVGGAENLGTLPGYTRSFAYEITETGTVFGTLQCWLADAACGGEFAETLVRWDRAGGAWTITPLQGCSRTNDDVPVNDNYQCVGRTASSQLAVQTLNGGAVVNSQTLPKLDPAGNELAYEISNAPMVAGHATSGGQTRPVIWHRNPAGAWVILSLTLPATYSFGSALDISEPDAAGRVRVSGRAAGTGRGYSALRWTLEPDGLGGLRVTSTQLLDAGKGSRSDSWGEAVDAVGDVAGHLNIQPVFWPVGGGKQVLPMPSGGNYGRAFDMNDNGWIVGWVFDRASNCDRAAVWRLL